jgi:predicted phage terminase large subunit-like protein
MLKRQLPKQARINAAISMFLALLDFADQKQDRVPGIGKMLETYDTAHAIADWGRKYCPHLLRSQKTGKETPFATIHFVLFAALLYAQRVLVVLPRGFGKSIICTVIYPLYCICRKKKRYIMIGSYVAANAQKMVYTLRAELEHNPQIKRDYGNLKTESDRWTDEYFITTDDVVVEAIYYGKGDVRGSRYINVRPELVVLDDLQTKEQAKNPERCRDLVAWIYDEIAKLYIDVQIIVVGTIVEDGDAICQLIEDAELLHDVDGIMAGLHSSEPIAARRFRLVMCEASDAEVSYSAWPAMFPVETLAAMRAENEASYDQEMRHLPRSRLTRDFHTFHYYDRRELDGLPLQIFTGFDLIPGITNLRERRGKDTDYYARCALARTALRPRDLYVYSLYRLREATKAQMVADALDNYKELRAIDPTVRIRGEANTFQVWFLDELAAAAADEGLYPPIDAINSKGDKIDRITSMDTAVNTGRMKFLRGDPMQEILIAELRHIRNARVHDDCADALQEAYDQALANRAAPGSAEAAVNKRPRKAMGF